MSADEETVKREQLESQETGDSGKVAETQNTPDTEDKAEEQSTEEQQRPASRDGSDQDTVCPPLSRHVIGNATSALPTRC
jgi:hypothetical protein